MSEPSPRAAPLAPRLLSPPRLLPLAAAGGALYGAFFLLLPLLRGIDESGVPHDGLLGVGPRVARALWGPWLYAAPEQEGLRRLLVIGTFALLLAAFGLQLRAAKRGARLSRRTVLLCAAAFSIPLALTDFPFYTDVYSYISYGRISVVYGGNPYFDVPQQFPDVFVQSISRAWRYNASLYGPVWACLSSLLTRGVEALGGAPWLYVLAYKLLTVGAHLTSGALIYDSVRISAPGRETLAAVAYAWNPLCLAETAWNAHNDVVMLAFALLALRLYAKGRPGAGVVALSASVLVKWVTALAAPLYVIAWARQAPTPPRALARVATAAGAFAAVALLTFAPVWRGPQTLFEPLRYAFGNHFTRNSLGDLALFEHRDARFREGAGPDPRNEIDAAYGPMIAHFDATNTMDWSRRPPPPYPGAGRAVWTVAALLTASVWARWLWRVFREPTPDAVARGAAWSLFGYFAFGCLWFWPWYVVTLVGLAALSPGRRVFSATLVLSVSVWAVYLGAAGWLGDAGQRFRSLLAFGPPLLCIGLAFARRAARPDLARAAACSTPEAG